MKLRLQTDYALRTLIYLGFTERKGTADEIANAFLISKDHLIKVIQQLAQHGFVRTFPGRHGGVGLRRPAEEISIRDVIQAMEGRTGVLDCVNEPTVCPMEPGCGLRKLLMQAEHAFYEALGSTTVADLASERQRGGIVNLKLP